MKTNNSFLRVLLCILMISLVIPTFGQRSSSGQRSSPSPSFKSGSGSSSWGSSRLTPTAPKSSSSWGSKSGNMGSTTAPKSSQSFDSNKGAMTNKGVKPPATPNKPLLKNPQPVGSVNSSNKTFKAEDGQTYKYKTYSGPTTTTYNDRQVYVNQNGGYSSYFDGPVLGYMPGYSPTVIPVVIPVGSPSYTPSYNSGSANSNWIAGIIAILLVAIIIVILYNAVKN